MEDGHHRCRVPEPYEVVRCSASNRDTGAEVVRLIVRISSLDLAASILPEGP